MCSVDTENNTVIKNKTFHYAQVTYQKKIKRQETGWKKYLDITQLIKNFPKCKMNT